MTVYVTEDPAGLAHLILLREDDWSQSEARIVLRRPMCGLVICGPWLIVDAADLAKLRVCRKCRTSPSWPPCH